MAETTLANDETPMPQWKSRLLFAYIAVGFVVLIWKLIEFFPGKPTDAAVKVTWFNIPFEGEGRLILTALLAGMVGGFVHIAVSYAQYRASRKLTEEWFAWYLLRPVVGGGLAMAFYAVIRAGFVTPGAATEAGATQILSPYGILAVGLLVGLCNAQAERKLRDIGEALFATSKGSGDYERAKAAPAITPTPRISTIEPQKLSSTVAGTQVAIKGTGFDPTNPEVKLDGQALTVVSATTTELRCEFAKNAPELSGGEHMLEVKNTGATPKSSTPFKVIVTP